MVRKILLLCFLAFPLGASALDLQSPVKNCSFSPGTGKDYIVRKHPILGVTHHHSGLDLSAPTGTKYYAPGDGVITSIGYANSRCGYIIEIRHAPKLYTHSCHLNRSGFPEGLKVGSRVTKGQLVAEVGATGTARGPHSHFVVKSAPGFSSHMDPYKVIAEFCGVSRARARGQSRSGSDESGGTR